MGGTRIAWLGLVIIMVLFVSACVRPTPVPPTSTLFIPSPTPPVPLGQAPPTPEPSVQAPPLQGPTFPPGAITQWLAANLAMNAVNLVPFTQLQVGPDDIVGYKFFDSFGNPCVGVAQTTASTAQVWTADFRCFAPGTPAIAAPLLFALTNGQPYIAAYGFVDMSLAPNASAVAVLFPDGSSENDFLQDGGFVVLHQGLNMPTSAMVIGANEETIVPNLPVQ